MKAYAVFENATDNTFKHITKDEFEDKWHLHHSIPTVAWYEPFMHLKGYNSNGFVRWRKETHKISHYILFATKKEAEEHVFEKRDETTHDYLIKEVEVTLTETKGEFHSPLKKEG
tara:strand:+ start:66 stop:410 length:345 start_codon:yes stop_codon:yes gene_type:complete